MSIWADHLDAQGQPTGRVYDCLTPSGNGGGNTTWASYTFWAAENPVATAVDPAVLGQRAVERMHLRPPTLGATPLPSETAASVVGLPTWLWVDQPTDQTWGPITRSATAGGITVTATAAVTAITYNMGDGNTVHCTGPGRAWTPAARDTESPDCGYHYPTPGNYTIQATAHWRANWHGAGQSGVIEFNLTDQREIRVTEIQVLVTR